MSGELKPKFGDLVENGWASEDNPTRRGFFVREFRRAGRMNPGLTWEITDGRGKFWTFKPNDIAEDGRLKVTSARVAPPAPGGADGLVERLWRKHRKTDERALQLAGEYVNPDGPEAAAEIEALRARVGVLEDAVERIVRWADAYPLDIFPEPDFKKVRAALDAAGITLDSVSASNMRHVVEGVGKIARQALQQNGGG